MLGSGSEDESLLAISFYINTGVFSEAKERNAETSLRKEYLAFLAYQFGNFNYIGINLRNKD